MAITSVASTTGLTQPLVQPEAATLGSVDGPVNQTAATACAPDAQRLVKTLGAPPTPKLGRAQGVSAQQLDELKGFASRDGLEVRLEQLPRNGGTVIRFVKPGTGEVVRQFPPEGVVRMLAELRAQAEGRLDRQA